MPRIKLNFKDVAGSVFDNYGQKYQEILKNFKDSNISANQYRDDIKQQKLTENRNKALAQVRNLKNSFNQDLLKALDQAKDKYTKELQTKKDSENINEIFNGSGYGESNMKAMKAIYDSINRNSKLVMATNILKLEHIPSIEKFLDNNLGDEETRELMEAYIRTKPDKEGQFSRIISKIQDARTTPIDDVNGLMGQARSMGANFDTFPELNSNTGIIINRNIQSDFTDYSAQRAQYFNDNNFDAAQAHYFK